tara:strand:- start:148 stop:324 length:177 start_codon:yes stop_codon:yes gene_type:complete
MNGSCLPYRFVKMRSWSVKPPCVLGRCGESFKSVELVEMDARNVTGIGADEDAFEDVN